MIRLFFTLFVIIYISVFLSIATKQTIGNTIPMTYVVLSLTLFVLSPVMKISYFKYVVLLIMGLVTICLLIKRKELDFNKYCLKPSLFVYVIFFIYLYFVLRNVQLSNIDDIGYWGTRILDINRTDALYTHEYTVFQNFTYPPFTALISMVFIKLFGVFDQSFMLLAQASFSFSLFLSLFDKYELKIETFIKNIIVLLIVILTTLMIQNNNSFCDEAFIYNSLYVDWILGLLLAKALSKIYVLNDERSVDLIEIGLYETALVLTKPTGLALILIVFVAVYAFFAVKNNSFVPSKKYLYYVVGVPVVFYVFWKIYFGIYAENKSLLNSKIIIVLAAIVVLFALLLIILKSLFEKYKDKINYKILMIVVLALPIIPFLLCLLLKNSAVYNNYFGSITIRFIITCFTSPIITKIVNLSYYTITIIITIALFIVLKIRNKDDKFYAIPVLYYLGSIGYALMILLSYLFVFGYEGYTLVVFGRYMQTYTYAGICLFILILLSEELNNKSLLLCLVASSLFIERESLKTIAYNKDWANYRNENQITEIDNYFEYEYNYETMVVFAQNDMRDLSLIGYLVDEKKVNISYCQGLGENDFDRFVKAVEENEYILVANRDKILEKFWKEISNNEPYNMTLYKVIHSDVGYSVELVKSWDDVK